MNLWCSYESFTPPKGTYQGFCAKCNYPFLYAPVKHEVRQDESGDFVHVDCAEAQRVLANLK